MKHPQNPNPPRLEGQGGGGGGGGGYKDDNAALQCQFVNTKQKCSYE